MAKKVESFKHNEKRVNIPTEELKDFMTKEQKKEEKILYPRDTSLDPQLVWKGKDEQDSHPLEVPNVPIYIQEKIHPQAIIDDLHAWAKKDKPEPQVELFSDFNGLDDDFQKKVEFYSHEQQWTNRMILGDSQLVMTSLAEREGLKAKVQMIYMDPPYGIKFGSNWQVSTRNKKLVDTSTKDLTRQPEQIRAYRDTWNLGIHSYLIYLKDRLLVARELLTESGSLFLQMGEDNLHLARCIMDEVFGAENYVATIIFKTAVSQNTMTIPRLYDYLIWYSKSVKDVKIRKLYRERTKEEIEKNFPFRDSVGRLFKDAEIKTANPEELQRMKKSDRIAVVFGKDCYKRYPEDTPITSLINVWDDTVMGTFQTVREKIYAVQTNTKVVNRCILMTTDPGDLVLDPTCGSGTTIYSAEQFGRRWITIDTSRVAMALARTRIMTAKYPYYYLVDSPEGILKEATILGLDLVQRKTVHDLRKGFIYKRASHILPKNIKENEDIEKIYSKYFSSLETLRKNLNDLADKSWDEWEMPRELEKSWSDEIIKLHKDWWDLRRKRQKEMDDSIARHANTEIRYDQPYEDNKRIRVTGPFTVESLSPHRRLSIEEKTDMKEGKAAGLEGVSIRTLGPDTFGMSILENLKKAGVQNTIKNERLVFDRLDPYAGEYIHAEGEYTEKDGKVKRVAVCIGPEYGTVGPDLIKDAAKEAVKGIGFDTLLVCGFAFEAIISEEARQYGKLTILTPRMNPDLSMGDELLKKTGAGNLFMIFGEPDIEIRHIEDGKIEVEIHGLDIYDPTTGEIRNSSTDDIACWFIDTDYNGESFFVRHAYFTGAGDPYSKLKRALKAEIDMEAWSALYQTVSRPVDPPESGKIAIKVINHYGDEVLKVYSIEQ